MKIDDKQKVLDEDRIADRVTELLDIYDKGVFNNNHYNDIENYAYMSDLRYEHLIALFSMRNVISGCDKLYSIFYKAYIQYGKSMVRKKISEGKKIKVAFLPISAAEWPAEGVYRRLAEDDRFDVNVIPVPLIGRDYNDRSRIYKQTYEYFKENNYELKSVYNSDTDELYDWDEVGGMPDIVINVTPWYLDMAEYYQITRLPASVLNVYISYGLSVGTSPDGSYDKIGLYNNDFINMQWRVYTESVQDYEAFVRYELLKGSNVRNSGYAKMDYFYETHSYSEDELEKIWKIPDGCVYDDMKKIILAPHFSVGNISEVSFSTFGSNMYYFLYLAQKYKYKVTFIFKPHPNLRNAVVKSGYMKSYDEYEEYLDRWRELPNGNVVEEADYLKLFETSDAMIMYSMSFVGEYLYFQKPLLFLTREEQNFNDLGEALMEAHYTADGRDYMSIDMFIQNVVINGDDVKKDIRKDVFYRQLDYYGRNGINASEYIYRDMCNDLML